MFPRLRHLAGFGGQANLNYPNESEYLNYFYLDLFETLS
jgi:hypothetical protein